jgi:hypothetical protein
MHLEMQGQVATPFLAEFTGANLLRGTARATRDGLTEVLLQDGTRLLSADAAAGAVGVIVYPWEIALARELPLDSRAPRAEGGRGRRRELQSRG